MRTPMAQAGMRGNGLFGGDGFSDAGGDGLFGLALEFLDNVKAPAKARAHLKRGRNLSVRVQLVNCDVVHVPTRREMLRGQRVGGLCDVHGFFR